MNRLRITLVLAALLVPGWSACSDKPDEPESERSAGDEVEKAADDTGDAIEEGAEDTGDAVEEGAEDTGDAVDEATE